ncbi:hypothetical protein IMZ48_16965 [Candidatus Bathyarchaeota archaeon]|nr:hypothetical protein [Candidatus Bathyarchaeota archaeon]
MTSKLKLSVIIALLTSKLIVIALPSGLRVVVKPPAAGVSNSDLLPRTLVSPRHEALTTEERA